MNDFIVGANLPWIAYGDFGANSWHPAGVLQGRTADLARALDRVATAGIRRIRWFMLCDGRAGVRFAHDGTPLGLDASFFSDVETAIAAAGDRDIEIMFVLLDFLWCAPARSVGGVQLGGRVGVLQDGLKRAALLNRVLQPIFEEFGRNRQIFAWDIVNEPEWVTCGLGARPGEPCVGLKAMRALVRDAAALVHQHTRQQATVGAAAANWLEAWRDLDLDFYQAHWYEPLEDRAPLARPVRLLGLDRPVMLGEFPSRVAAGGVRRILDTARKAGYSAAFVWSVLANDDATDFAMAEPDLGTRHA